MRPSERFGRGPSGLLPAGLAADRISTRLGYRLRNTHPPVNQQAPHPTQVQAQYDSGQDALIVRVTTDAGLVGYGEVDSNPMAVKGCIEGPFSHTATTGLAQVVIGEDPFLTEYLWHKMYRANIYAG